MATGTAGTAWNGLTGVDGGAKACAQDLQQPGRHLATAVSHLTPFFACTLFIEPFSAKNHDISMISDLCG